MSIAEPIKNDDDTQVPTAALYDMGAACVASAGHWIKLLLHYMFIYKAKAGFGWFLIPE